MELACVSLDFNGGTRQIKWYQIKSFNLQHKRNMRTYL